MQEVMENHPQVFLICPSREHLQVDIYNPVELLHRHDMSPTSTTRDMEIFIERRWKLGNNSLSKTRQSSVPYDTIT
jgi:hypothetical protein